MYYIFIPDGKAYESIPEFNLAFPGVPVAERYSAEFLAKCVTSEIEIPYGWIYDAEAQTFSEPPELLTPA